MDTDDRKNLKEQRKLRKKLKKEAKQREKQLEKDARGVKLQPSYSRLKIVKHPQSQEAAQCDEYSSNTIDEFPLIGEKKPKSSATTTQMFAAAKENHDASVVKNKTRKKLDPIEVDLESLMRQKRPMFYETICNDERKIYAGNPMDASKPVRMVGKHREVPKQKRLSKIKDEVIVNETIAAKTIPYCENAVTDELNEAVARFVEKIVTYQENAYKKDPARGTMRRRYVVGLHEVKKYLVAKKVRFLIIATDLKIYSGEDRLHDVVAEMVAIAKLNDVRYVFALKRSKIGRLTLKYVPIGCMGIFNYEGAEEELNAVVDAVNSSNESRDAENDVYVQLLDRLKDCLLDG